MPAAAQTRGPTKTAMMGEMMVVGAVAVDLPFKLLYFTGVSFLVARICPPGV
jgi:hypothetical protein